MRMPGNYLDLIIMSFKAVDFLVSFSHVENFDLAVFASCQKPVSIYWVPSHTVNHCMRSSYFVPSFSSSSWIPNLYSLILAACNYQWVERVPFTWLNIAFVFGEWKFFFCCCKIKNPSCNVVGAGDKLHAAWSEREIINLSLIVSWKFYLLTKLCIWVYNISKFVPRDNILVKLRYSDRSDLCFMQRCWVCFKVL